MVAMRNSIVIFYSLNAFFFNQGPELRRHCRISSAILHAFPHLIEGQLVSSPSAIGLVMRRRTTVFQMRLIQKEATFAAPTQELSANDQNLVIAMVHFNKCRNSIYYYHPGQRTQRPNVADRGQDFKIQFIRLPKRLK